MKKVFLFLLIMFLPSFILAEEARDFPFTGVISGDNVNVRAGANLNFEAITRLNNDEKVIVLAESYGWYKIKLPPHAACYISKKYIEVNKEEGVVRASRVNVRSAAGFKSSVLGQLNKGDKVAISEEGDAWLKIKPPQGCAAWVKSDFVKYYSTAQAFVEEQEEKKGEPEKKKEELVQKEEEKPAAIKAEEKKELKEVKRKRFLSGRGKSKPAMAPIAQGYIDDVGRVFGRRGTHKLVKEGKTIAYLRSKQYNLNDYVYYEVQIWGNKVELPKTEIPLIVVKRVKIVP